MTETADPYDERDDLRAMFYIVVRPSASDSSILDFYYYRPKNIANIEQYSRFLDDGVTASKYLMEQVYSIYRSEIKKSEQDRLIGQIVKALAM